MSLIDNIKISEGFRSRPYRCTENHLTIGYGFAIKDLELDEDICDMILERKVAKLVQRLEKNLPYLPSLPKDAQDVLIEMSYQMGLSGVKKFKLALKYMEHKNWDRAADEMLLSRWHSQTPRRCKELRNIIRSL